MRYLSNRRSYRFLVNLAFLKTTRLFLNALAEGLKLTPEKTRRSEIERGMGDDTEGAKNKSHLERRNLEQHCLRMTLCGSLFDCLDCGFATSYDKLHTIPFDDGDPLIFVVSY